MKDRMDTPTPADRVGADEPTLRNCPRCGQNHHDTSRPTVPVCPFKPFAAGPAMARWEVKCPCGLRQNETDHPRHAPCDREDDCFLLAYLWKRANTQAEGA